MGEYKLSSASISDMENTVEEWEVTPRPSESTGNQKESEWLNTKFTTYMGYYKAIPEVKTAIDTRAIWTIGDGFIADIPTSVVLEGIRGWGTDTFDSILENAVTIKRVGGDAFIEIVWDEDTGELLNLKPLDPAKIKIIVNDKGVIERYEQISPRDKTKPPKKFSPAEILHFSNKRVMDEIHGISDIEAIEDIIKANKESFDDMKKIMHHFVKPKLMVAVDSDDTVKIDEFVAKFDDATNKGENLFYPKGTVETPQVLAVPTNATLNPLPWREHLKNYFFQVVGIPQIIMGSSGEFTESTAKIAYLAFEQSVKAEQREIITQVWNKLHLKIDLAFPASLKNELLSDEAKDASGGMAGQMNVQPNEVTAGVGE